MSTQQPILLKSPEQKPKLHNGPIFEAGPGWGGKLRKKINKLSKKRGVMPVIIFLLFAVIWISFFKVINLKPTTTENKQASGTAKISETVLAGDNQTKLARRALSDYLTKFSEIKLTNGQRIFIEETLRRNLGPIEPGTNVELSYRDIQSAITQAQALSKSTLAKWEIYAKGIKF
jgi:hypothetical protein